MGSLFATDMTCVLLVDTTSSGWQKSMKQILKRIQDISYTIDVQHGLAYISGRVDPKKIVNIIADAGKHVDLVRVDYGYNKPGRMAGALSLDYNTPYGSGSPYHYQVYDPQQEYWNNYSPYYYHRRYESPLHYPYTPCTTHVSIPPPEHDEEANNYYNYSMCKIM